MEIIYLLVPLSLILSTFGLFAFFWALRNGQFDDSESASYRAIFEEDEVDKS